LAYCKYISTQFMAAEGLTKPLGRLKHQDFILLRVYRDAANVGCSGHVTSEVRVTRVEGVTATFLGIRYPRSKQ